MIKISEVIGTHEIAEADVGPDDDLPL